MEFSITGTLRICLLLVCTSLVSWAAAFNEGTLEVRLQTHLTSYASPAGSDFQCVVIRDLEMDGNILIPAGTRVYGTVRRARAVGFGFVHERAGLDLRFNAYETPDGQRRPLTARLKSIDNAREQVLPDGHIQGILAADNPGELINGIWERPTSNLFYRSLIGLTGAGEKIWTRFSLGPAGAAGILAVRCLAFRFPEPEIYLPAGTDLKLVVNTARIGVALTPTAAKQIATPAPYNTGVLADWIQQRPYDVERPKGKPPGDMINVVFVGSSERLQQAFSAAGWQRADPMTMGSFSRLYKAFVGEHGYPSAPVSKLLYRGSEPDLIFEKSLDTVAKRHHVRIWHAGIFDGKDIWFGAATHDTGIAFKRRTFTFTHRIDPHIDVERSKIATDLTFAGCSEPAVYVDRDAPFRAPEQSRVTTDGRIAIFRLGPCEEQDSDIDAEPPKPGNRAKRLTRRVVLEARNYIVRDNAYYWIYKLVRGRRPEL